MSTKSVVIWVIVIIVVLIGGYLVYKNMGSLGGTGTQPATQTPATSATTTPQVQGQDVKVGTGAEATPGSVVSVLYIGKLQDGTTFDSSAAHGNQPLTFTLGAQGLIPGFQIGVNGMKVGGERQLLIPASLGYGTQDVKDSTGKVIIPANSELLFDIQLVSVTPGTSTPATTGATQ